MQRNHYNHQHNYNQDQDDDKTMFLYEDADTCQGIHVTLQHIVADCPCIYGQQRLVQYTCKLRGVVADSHRNPQAVA